MQLLVRRPGESIEIGDDIVATILEVKENQVLVGIEAPEQITVRRNEIKEVKGKGLKRSQRPNGRSLNSSAV